MRITRLAALALIAPILVCFAGAGPAVSSADARDYYTRKRVNGVWITGHFKRKRSVSTETAATPPAGAAADGEEERSPGAPAAGSDRPPFQRAAEARRAAALAFEPPPVEPILLPLRRALEARARGMAAATTGAIQPARAVRSMTLDFENRVRVILFTDGSRRQEPLDAAGLGALNANAVP